MDSLSPNSSFTSVTPSPTSHKRRRSSCSSDIVERRPKKGDEDYIKRPENAFILFRRKCCEDRQAAQEEAAAGDASAKKQRQADLSKTISQQWKSLSAEERQYWEKMAKEKKKEHEQMYPNYVYRPQRAKDKDGRSKSRKSKGLEETDTENVSFIIPARRNHGRSASAPTPPPYHTIQIPAVNHRIPSVPASPDSPSSSSLLLMISQRSSNPSTFDYCPRDNVSRASYGAPEVELPPLAGPFSAGGVYQQEIPYPHHISQNTLPENLPVPQHVFSRSSTDSGSSGPSSPSFGPYTPNSFMPSLLESMHTDLVHLEFDMREQQDAAQVPWEASWLNNDDSFLKDPWNLDSVACHMDLSKFPEFSEASYQESMVDPVQSKAQDTRLYVAGVDYNQDMHFSMDACRISDDGLIPFDDQTYN